MYSKIKIAGHPLHPILIAYPIAFYTSTLACFIVYQYNMHPFWFKAALLSNAAGVISALAAAVPGFIDWLFIPSEKKAKNVGVKHMLYNVTALMLFAFNLLLEYKKLNVANHNAIVAIILTSIGLFLTTIGGFLGGELMQHHHVGISLTKEQEDIEPLDGVQN
ncbi:MAG: hypothetical protein JWN78_2124 [Bacteroidota bacterium]|nr:hypothetical protein [Bacteroidota bacterium]